VLNVAVLVTLEEDFLVPEEDGFVEEDSLFVEDDIEDDLVEDCFVEDVVFVEDKGLLDVEILTEEDETFVDVREVCKEDLEELDEVFTMPRDNELEEAATTTFPYSKSKNSMQIMYTAPRRSKRNKRTIFIAMLLNFPRY